MNFDKIEKLVKIIEESSLQEFSIQEGDIKIKMSKRAGESVAVPFAPGIGMPVAGTAAPEAATADETSGRSGRRNIHYFPNRRNILLRTFTGS